MPDKLFIVESPQHNYDNVPLRLTITDWEWPNTCAWALEDTQNGEVLPLQLDDEMGSQSTCLWFILSSIGKGEVREFRLMQIEHPAASVDVKQMDAGILEITQEGKLVTRYNYGKEWARPHLWPLLAADGVEMTRACPEQEGPGEFNDHVHHKSVWHAHGDLNGSDNWSELPGSGRTQHDTFTRIVSGPVFGKFSTTEDWLTVEGEKILRSFSNYTIYALGGGSRMIDFGITFHATEKCIRFGDTKEGGILAVRVAPSMAGTHGGVIENGYGAISEEECWGKPAPWVDYSGNVNGTPHGIAIFDHPDNPMYPTRWHVRNYGLFAANPFALHDYLKTDGVDGSRTLQTGENWKFQYRMILHQGNASEAKIHNAFLAYAIGPVVRAAG